MPVLAVPHRFSNWLPFLLLPFYTLPFLLLPFYTLPFLLLPLSPYPPASSVTGCPLCNRRPLPRAVVYDADDAGPAPHHSQTSPQLD